jgi:hypothetical protein
VAPAQIAKPGWRWVSVPVRCSELDNDSGANGTEIYQAHSTGSNLVGTSNHDHVGCEKANGRQVAGACGCGKVGDKDQREPA